MKKKKYKTQDDVVIPRNNLQVLVFILFNKTLIKLFIQFKLTLEQDKRTTQAQELFGRNAKCLNTLPYAFYNSSNEIRDSSMK